MSELCTVKETTEGSVARALCRSLGGRNGKDHTFALSTSQQPSGVMGDAKEGPS